MYTLLLLPYFQWCLKNSHLAGLKLKLQIHTFIIFMSYYLISIPLPDPHSTSNVLFSGSSSPSISERCLYSESLDKINNNKIDHIYSLLKNEFMLNAPGICLDFRRWDIPTFKVYNPLLNFSLGPLILF